MTDFYKTERVEAVRAVDGKWLVINEDGTTTTWENEEFLRTFTTANDIIVCDSCGSFIDALSEMYYILEDGSYKCDKCGGEILVNMSIDD